MSHCMTFGRFGRMRSIRGKTKSTTVAFCGSLEAWMLTFIQVYSSIWALMKLFERLESMIRQHSSGKSSFEGVGDI